MKQTPLPEPVAVRRLAGELRAEALRLEDKAAAMRRAADALEGKETKP